MSDNQEKNKTAVALAQIDEMKEALRRINHAAEAMEKQAQAIQKDSAAVFDRLVDAASALGTELQKERKESHE